VLKLWQLLKGLIALIMASGVVLAGIAAFFFFALLFRVIGILALVVIIILALAYMMYDWWNTPESKE
jgi:hypothetical protein